MLLRAIVALGIAVVVLGLGSLGSADALDGPCLDALVDAPEGSTSHDEISAWPPGFRCVTTFPGGEVHERVYPGADVWLLALALGALPFAPSGWRRLRRPE